MSTFVTELRASCRTTMAFRASLNSDRYHADDSDASASGALNSTHLATIGRPGDTSPRCDPTGFLGASEIPDRDSRHSNARILDPDARPALFRRVVGAYFRSLYSAILLLQTKSIDRYGRISRRFLRDSQDLAAISVVYAIANLSHSREKPAGSLKILCLFPRTVYFALSFTWRQK